MPTPNWGPQAGTPMDQATFDAYVASNPPGGSTNGIYGPPQIGINSTNGRGAYQPPLPTGAAHGAEAPSGLGAMGTSPWTSFFEGQMNAGPLNIPGYQTANQDQARRYQQQVIQDLQRQAMGDPNSRAQQQLQQGYGQAQAQQASLGSTMRGQSAGASMRGIQAGQQGIQRGLAGDQQMLQLQEQQAAQQMLAQLLAQQQGQDISQAQGMAQGALGAQGLNDAMQQFYTGGYIDQLLGNYQWQADKGRAELGFDLEAQNLLDQQRRAAAAAAATGAGTLASMDWSGGKNSSYYTGLTPSWKDPGSSPSEWNSYPSSGSSIVEEGDK